ncbi:DUF4403 family protein [Sphingomonas cavernae]|uniref:DUF4403 family protein n=1 Tax=Sphingomonas cavernae TaxID=2320861 RepID=A0A418W6I1_9SPHN|nr:DUF4403 family protein [Sphingomonas cavernae]RJF85640.1 DUF4403 family protein [Sphingomonas cavernae]
MRHWSTAQLFIGIAGLAVAGCSEQASNPAPPRLETPVSFSDKASTIRLPVGFPLRDLEKAINDEVPTLLYTIDEPQQTCVKTKSKLLPDISCRLVGTVRRGPIDMSGSGESLLLTIPIRTTVSARNIGKIIKQETANGAITVRAKVRLGLTPDWHPTARVEADYAWTNKVGIDFLGRRITFASKVDPQIRALLTKLEHSLPRHLSRLQLREKIAPIWAKGFTSVRAKTDPPIWVRFTPEQVGFSGYKVEGDKLVIGFSARARTQTLVGGRPENPPVTPLPNLMGALPPGGINVHVPVMVRYAMLEDAARAVLVSKDYKSLKLKNGGTVDAIFHDVSIYGAQDDRMAVGLDVSLRTLEGALSAKGKVWFVAEPVVDIPNKIVSIRNLKLAGQTDSRIFNRLLEAINKTAIRDRMVQAIRYDFTNDYLDGLRKADEWLQAQPFEGFVFKGDMGDAQIRSVRIAPDGLLVEADATGTAAMTYAPAEAAKLVAERRARRAARDRAAAAAAAGSNASAAR